MAEGNPFAPGLPEPLPPLSGSLFSTGSLFSSPIKGTQAAIAPHMQELPVLPNLQTRRNEQTRDMAGFFVGPMPVEEFLATFTPKTSGSEPEIAFEDVFKPMEEVAKDSTPQPRKGNLKGSKKKKGKRKTTEAKMTAWSKKILGKSRSKGGKWTNGGTTSAGPKEKDMYPVLLDCIQEVSLCPHLEFVDTSNRYDKSDLTLLKPDVSVYSKSARDGEEEWPPQTTSWQHMELCVELKSTIHDDPFTDAIPQIPAPNFDIDPWTSYEDEEEAPNKGPETHYVAEGVEQGSGLPTPYKLERMTADGIKHRGQLWDYARLQWERQERAFFFHVLICQDTARFLRYDRAGVVVSARFQYQKTPYLAQFLSRFDSMSDSERGKDTTVSIPTLDEVVQAKVILGDSVDNDCPMRKVAIHDSTGVKYVITSKVLFRSKAITSRATRCYVAADLATNKRVLLKDAWRYDHHDIRPEGDTYALLHEKGVSNIATMSYHGDVPHQRTVTKDYKEKEWAKFSRSMNSHQHYRIVLDTIGKRVTDAPSSQIVVKVLLGALIAHWEAYDKAGILHRDLSPNNILYDEATQEGILIDWDLCRDRESLGKTPARLPGRTGTWQFISCRLLQEPALVHTLQDDLESAFWILLWVCLHLFPSSLSKRGILRDTLHRIFDEGRWAGESHCLTGGSEKSLLILQGTYIMASSERKPKIVFKVVPLNNLVYKIWELFQARALPDLLKNVSAKALAAELDTSEEMIRLFRSAVNDPNWPKDDRKDMLEHDRRARLARMDGQGQAHCAEQQLKHAREGESQMSVQSQKSRRETLNGDAASASRTPVDEIGDKLNDGARI